MDACKYLDDKAAVVTKMYAKQKQLGAIKKGTAKNQYYKLNMTWTDIKL